MDFDDIFEQNKHRKHGNDHHNYGNNHHDYYEKEDKHHTNGHHVANDSLMVAFNKIQNNPKLKMLIIIGGIIIVILILILVVVLFPYIIKLLNFTGENGLKGILDMILNGKK